MTSLHSSVIPSLELTDEHIQIIKSSIPLLASAGTEVTEYFYQRLFSHHPELHNIFNTSNQKSGRQQFALFSALANYATHIDNLAALQSMVERIANKHASLHVLPEHYPIVGNHLIHTMKALFPNDFTSEHEEAWTAAYFFLANIFIDKEQGIYQSNADKTGGWAGTRQFVLVEKRMESELVKSLVFEPTDGLAVSDYIPGQYLGIKLRIPGQQFEEIRQYSLSDKPNGHSYRISVKREMLGEPGVVSNYLHDGLRLGDTLELLAPVGDFQYREEKTPDVLISAGVGLTPMQAILETLADKQSRKPVHYLHACESLEQHSFRRRLTELASSLNLSTHVWYRHQSSRSSAEHHGLMDISSIQKELPLDDGHFYLCGPIPFMKFVKNQLLTLGVANDRIHYEVFGPHDDF